MPTHRREPSAALPTDPGVLVLDPTCGSGTTASFKYHRLRPLLPEDLQHNPRGAWLRNGAPQPMRFACKTVPHITLKSIARNTALDAIFARHEPVLAERLAALNRALPPVDAALKARLAAKLIAKHREQGTSAVTEADQRR